MPASNSEARKRLEEQTGWRYLVHASGTERGPFMTEAAARQHQLELRDGQAWTVTGSVCAMCRNWRGNHDPACHTLTGGG